MIRPPLRLQALCLLSAFSVGALPALRAQSQPTPTPAPAALEEETVVLSPFVVEASEDDGYRAKATLAGTRIRTELKDVGASVSAITEKFLQDTNSNRVEDLLVYTVGTEVAGQGGNYLGQGDSTFLTDTNRTSPIANTRVRGLAEADNTRDFFLSDIPWDSYNIGRVDLQRGPNSILFGIGSPAGIVNSSVNSAAFKNSGEIENVVSSYQSVRFSADLNRVLLQDELAVRASYLRDDAEFRQDPAFRNDHRTFFALRFDPKLLNGGSARTSLRVSYENGNVKSNLPRNTPPLDAITPWFNNLNQLTVDARVSNDVASTQPWLGAPGNRVFDGVITTFNDGGQGFAFPAKVQPWPDTGTPVPGTIVGNNGLKGIGSFDVFANRSGLPGSTISAFKARSLGDSSVFDFFNNLIEGPNKAEFNDFKAFNAALTQTFFHDKLGVEFAYDYQQARWGFANFLSGDGAAVTVDIISTLLDGTPNPNVGRPLVIAGGGSAGGYWEGRTRNTARVTAFADLDFRDLAGKDSFLGRVFGRNTLTGLYSTQHINDENRDYSRYYLANSFGPNVGQGAVGQASRDDIFYVYLGNSLLGQSTAAGIGLTGVKNALTPQPTNITVYNNLANTFQSIPLDIVNNSLASDDNKTYRRARKTRESIASTALVWQGYWFDGAVVPMIGYRHDNDNFKDAGNAPDLGGGLVNPQAPQWQLPDEGTVATGNSTTYSLVVHTPEFIKRHLPLGLDLGGFYNQSDNFQPKSGRRDIMGDAIANPAGKTKEWGFTLSALDDRVYLKAARYKTKVNNADVSGGIFGQYLIGANEAWGQRAAYKFKNETGVWPADTIFGLTSTGQRLTWRPAGPIVRDANGQFAYSQAQIDATFAREQASINDWFAHQAPEKLQAAWALNGYNNPNYDASTNFGASGLSVTGDTASKGWEFELGANVIKGLDVSFNAAKTSAQRTNLASSYVDWINQRWSDLQGPMGEMRLWGGDDDFAVDGTHSGETARGKFRRETLSGFNLFNALQDSDVPELRPWRFNVVANYQLQTDGLLKGTNVGGSYRWQDKNVTGFPVIVVNGLETFDVNNPYQGSNEGIMDLWVGHERQLTSKIRWRVQLNIRNALAPSRSLSRVTVQPDGSPGAYRIQEPRTFALTNTFMF